MILRPQKPPRRGELTQGNGTDCKECCRHKNRILVVRAKTIAPSSMACCGFYERVHLGEICPDATEHGKQYQVDFSDGAKAACGRRYYKLSNNKPMPKASSIGRFITSMAVLSVLTNMQPGQKGGVRSG